MAVDEDYLDAIAAAFGQVIDAKSPFTAGHSTRVGDLSRDVAAERGLDAAAQRKLYRAGLLHDVGKLGVSNMILDKPASLDAPEWAIMRDHAGHSGEILRRIGALADIADIAAAHHERIDGTGYPLRLAGDEIVRETRIITTCDYFDALTSDRPYRAAMSEAEALAIMTDEVGKALDGDCLAALRRVI